MDETPLISVMICTCNRGDAVSRTLQTVFANSYPSFEVLLIDQNRGEMVRSSLRKHIEGKRIRYFQSPQRGLAHGRNFAVPQCHGEIIACTDDDCDVSPDWLLQIGRAFKTEGRVGLVFGRVDAGPYDVSRGLIPCNQLRNAFLARSMRDKIRLAGMGACMAFRRAVWEALSGFDAFLGVGAPFHSGDENDFVIRGLLAGFWINETPDIRVVHNGFRTWKELDGLVYSYMFGTGALFAKHFRLNPVTMLRLQASVFWRWIFHTPLIKYETRTRRWYRLKCFSRGWWQGMRTPIDRERRVFCSPDRSSASAGYES
jgi:GT2 family glycosyltransferase